MRPMISFLIGLVSAASVVVFSILVVQNAQGVQLAFLGNVVQEPAGWLVAGAAALGFLLAFLLLIAGRLASAWHRGSLNRQAQALEDRLARLRMGLGELREQHAALQGSHQRLLEEHQQVLDHVLTPAGVRGAVVEASPIREPIGAVAGAAADAAAAPSMVATALPRTAPIIPAAPPAPVQRSEALVAPAQSTPHVARLDEHFEQD